MRGKVGEGEVGERRSGRGEVGDRRSGIKERRRGRKKGGRKLAGGPGKMSLIGGRFPLLPAVGWRGSAAAPGSNGPVLADARS